METRQNSNIRISRFAQIILALVLVMAVTTTCGKSEAAKQAGVHWQSGNTLAEQNAWAEATDEYSRSIELDPKSDRAYEGRGIAYTALGDFDRAIADLSKAIGLRPDRGGPLYARGIAYRKQGNLDLAIADLSQAIGDRRKTRWRGALYERGLAYQEKRLITEARLISRGYWS